MRSSLIYAILETSAGLIALVKCRHKSNLRILILNRSAQLQGNYIMYRHLHQDRRHVCVVQYAVSRELLYRCIFTKIAATFVFVSCSSIMYRPNKFNNNSGGNNDDNNNNNNKFFSFLFVFFFFVSFSY